ncbi:hypothetical protein [Arenimonas sp.]|jgi:hypothetical protein|uniref:hypothetical protein n=1 Tax=Arenimonas sp. TaxID=1872635 RepID=UPI0037C0E116
MAKVAKIWDGTAWVDLATSVPDLSNYQLKSEGGLTFVKKQTIGTAVSSVTVTDAFSATYDNYKIMVSSGVGSGTNYLTLSLGAANSLYYSALTSALYSNATVLTANTNNGAAFGQAGWTSPGMISLSVDVINPFLSKNTLISGNFAGTSVGGSMGGIQDSTTSFTAFTITPAGGVTLTGGTIYVYGYNKG